MLHHYLLKARLQKEGEHHVGQKMMNRITSILCAVSCSLIAGCTAVDPHRLIVEHLGVSPAGARILDEAASHPQNDPPDVCLLLYRLSELDQDRSLTLGIFLMSGEPDLMVTNYFTSENPAAEFRAVLSNNTTSAGTTFVRAECISNITIEAKQSDKTIGRFDWLAPGLLSGTCRFVIRGSKLEYLGFLRKNPVGTYDCETIFSRYGNLRDSRHWIRTEYFAAILASSKRTTSLDRNAKLLALQKLLGDNGIGSSHWPIRDPALPIVYSGEREDRDRVIALLEDSDDWDVVMSGRAVGNHFEQPLDRSIEEQITGVANQ